VRWVRCSDAEVRPCSLAEALGAQAYLLLYARRDAAGAEVRAERELLDGGGGGGGGGLSESASAVAVRYV